MTARKVYASSRKISFKWICALICTACISAFLYLSDIFADSIIDTMGFVCLKIIPSLFPFMVISGVLLESGSISVYQRLFGKAFARIFHVSPSAAGAVILGFISGFPVGAHTVCDLYERGYLTKKEAENALCVAHNTGPGFIVGVIGGALWKNVRFGVSLYIFQLISSALLSILLSGKNHSRKSNDPTPVNRPLAQSVVTAITKASYSCLTLTAFIVFWKMLADGLVLLLPDGSPLGALLTAFLEFSSGAESAARIGGRHGVVLCGFSVGFGGISALTQAAYKTGVSKLSCKRCFMFKFTQGILCAILCALSYNALF